ncbi:antA/AntB antirepressor family protein [Mannheimia pernigra]|uniref:antA/AntB antirepressor family protein n=1 Tax=Mannheimia pernigra TaxID=111844 RepID=UPI001318912D|nr:antA/AntB antirepressor family protein [Mannheimia pernigra]QHB17688.1 hypothetical protein GM695_06395 [Mannheimia pernigra]
MTNSLITVFNGSISNQTVQLANARDLHSFLESNQDFSNWIANRISEYGFVQDEDYITLEIKTRGRPRKEYHITLDMGKELAIVERNEKGRQIRKYFIECEREMKRLQKEAENRPLAELPKTYTAEMTAQDIHALVWLFFSHAQMNGLLGHLIKPLEAIGSRYAPNVYGNHTEYKRHLKECEPILKHLLDQIKQDKPKEFEQLLHRLTA